MSATEITPDTALLGAAIVLAEEYGARQPSVDRIRVAEAIVLRDALLSGREAIARRVARKAAELAAEAVAAEGAKSG